MDEFISKTELKILAEYDMTEAEYFILIKEKLLNYLNLNLMEPEPYKGAILEKIDRTQLEIFKLKKII